MTSTTEAIQQLGYNSTVEEIYTHEHPEVVANTKQFQQRTTDALIFETYQTHHPKPSFQKAKVVGTQWHRFSSFMPWFLCQAAATVSTNEMRHYVIQTAFEELGMRDVSEIHPDMFWEACLLAGVTPNDRQRLDSEASIGQTLEYLKTNILAAHSDAEVMGMLLGLEIPAVENIETVYSALGHDKETLNKLDNGRFFPIHRQVEIEHVRLTVSNFLRFCKSKEAKVNFYDGFDKGIAFWKMFWAAMDGLISSEIKLDLING